MKSPWQRIGKLDVTVPVSESAPFDGEDYLLWSSVESVYIGSWEVYMREWASNDPYVSPCPTHWAPIPSPPDKEMAELDAMTTAFESNLSLSLDTGHILQSARDLLEREEKVHLTELLRSFGVERVMQGFIDAIDTREYYDNSLKCELIIALTNYKARRDWEKMPK